MLVFFSLTFFAIAYFSAQEKLNASFNIQALRLGMTLEELKTTYGPPFAQNRNLLTYIFEDSSELIVTLRDDVVSSAQLKYQRPLKIQDPDMRRLTLIQMHTQKNDFSPPTWFFAGKPEDGLIYKITTKGFVESLTWIQPFSYESNRPKQLQALLQDFQGQHLSNL